MSGSSKYSYPIAESGVLYEYSPEGEKLAEYALKTPLKPNQD
jgi:hypothetical protein